MIATGLKPRSLDVPGNEYLLTSNDVFNMEELPESVAIIGGGYIAMEIASLLSVRALMSPFFYVRTEHYEPLINIMLTWL